MADLTIAAADVRPVRIADEHFHTAPALEAIVAGQYIRLDPSTGKFRLGNASDATEIGDGYFAGNSAAIGEPVTGYKRPCVFEVGNALSGMNFGAKGYVSATDGAFADANVGAREKQTVTITGGPTGGTFTLTYAGQTTSAIAYNATAATVEAALEALSTIGQGNVQVTGNAGGPYTVEFVGQLQNQNVAAMTADGSSLTGGTTPGVTIATATAGVESAVAFTVVPGWADTTAKKLMRLEL